MFPSHDHVGTLTNYEFIILVDFNNIANSTDEYLWSIGAVDGASLLKMSNNTQFRWNGSTNPVYWDHDGTNKHLIHIMVLNGLHIIRDNGIEVVHANQTTKEIDRDSERIYLGSLGAGTTPLSGKMSLIYIIRYVVPPGSTLFREW